MALTMNDSARLLAASAQYERHITEAAKRNKSLCAKEVRSDG